MTVDLLQACPDLDTRPFSHLLPSLDKALVTTNDLLTLDAQDVAKRAQVPAQDLKKLADAILVALHRDLGFGLEEDRSNTILSPAGDVAWNAISTLDSGLDAALGGGIPPGYLVEVTGESGAGKTQLLLTLLLSSQLPPPRGISKSALYISTEAPLATTRLTQLLATNAYLCSLPAAAKPSLDRILSIQTPDLESQDHILRYQLPVAIRKHGIGLVVIDSVAANYRAEFERAGVRAGAAAMARRGTELVQLGAMLRQLARNENIAIVVANQVGDRFTANPSFTTNPTSRNPSHNSQNSNLREKPDMVEVSNQEPEVTLISPDPLALDHQQRWFTGWGDVQPSFDGRTQNLKTPSLGLVWANQISSRLALIKEPVYNTQPLVTTTNGQDTWTDGEKEIVKWRRWLKVVFAPWAAPTDAVGVEFEILGTGLRHVAQEQVADE
ncbi:P-loop containing nucleoside triphosphate hydrolase protein [Lophium mytilinum]|uniref:P-loop containing nucleoside triphosphate hydrolase protein n=1 Tax=Lophium mytilinum TaxID=390894 RepID=A0A6A6QH45_9PEZI|nr:P-loop containing nucleoside triphosphate hydrolase protein [Lophium mytilinum]